MRKKKAKPQPQIIMVSNGCGCIFCDLDLAPTRRDSGHLVHHTQSGFVPCTKPE